MGPFNDKIFAKGPTNIIIPNPDQHDQLPTPDTSMAPSPFTAENEVSSPTSFANHSTMWTPTSSSAPMSTNPSRKRSRDESSFDSVLADGSYFPSQTVNTPAPIPEEEPIYGEGMVLINPRTGMSVSAESQTGTWYEEKVEIEARRPAIPESEVRPEMLSRKSQRLDASAPKLDDLAQSALPASPPKLGPVQVEPAVDDFTLSLGIGWTRIANEDPAIQGAARGWAKYIDNHFTADVHGAQILLKSKGLNAYLVGAQEGFFLFSDDLSEGRFIGRTWDVTLGHLRSHPMVFEGDEVLRAARTPGPETSTAMSNGFTAIQNGTNGTWSMNGHAQGVPRNGTSVHEGGMDID